MEFDYKIYTDTSSGKEIKVIKAIGKYAGRAVSAVAKCNPEDSYDEVFGKALAAKRCEIKINEKRYKALKKRSDYAAREITALINMANQKIRRTSKREKHISELENTLNTSIGELKALMDTVK